MSIYCSAAEDVSTGSWFIMFNIATLNVASLTMFFSLCQKHLDTTKNVHLTNECVTLPAPFSSIFVAYEL